ncbi:MAG: coproporphyrinogen-III oxidase family protein [Phascolarctobacterium sp.]
MKILEENIWQQYKAIYVHIPFCKQKCLYCDFASYACFGEQEMRAYTEVLCHEIKVRAEEAAKVAAGATIYFGGGTPSVLPIECIERIVATLKECGFWSGQTSSCASAATSLSSGKVDLAQVLCGNAPREATIEVNPGTADLAKLERLRAAGFDRISFGVQSLQDEELRTIGRIHSASEALQAIEMAKQAGFARISCDLIYGLPGQSLASLENTVGRLIETGIEHMSVYGLIVEEGTPLERLVDEGKMLLPDEDLTADMYELVQDKLAQAGYERYEISNYAKNGQYSRHNTVYWQYHPYIAFGAAGCGFDISDNVSTDVRNTYYADASQTSSSHTCWPQTSSTEENVASVCENTTIAYRRTAISTVPEYITAARVMTPASWRSSELYSIETITPAQQLEEFMFMGLRRSVGADLKEARERFGVDVWERYSKQLQRFVEQGYLHYDVAKQRLWLTPEGMEVGNQIFAVFVDA